MLKLRFLIIIIFGLIATVAFSQNKVADTTHKSTDTSSSNDEYWEESDMSNFDFDLFGGRKESEGRKSTIELLYGFINPSYKAYSGTLANTNSLDLKLGFTHYYNRDVSYIQKYKLRAFFASFNSQNLGKTDTTNVRADSWRFGYYERDGYAYKLGEHQSIALTNGGGFGWGEVSRNGYFQPSDSNNRKALDVFGNNLRFTQSSEAAVVIRLQDMVAVTASYEREIIFPRFMFWYSAASSLIEKIGNGALDYIVKPIFKTSPSVAPVVNFILKNALSMGMQELRRKYMDWPIQTAPPLLNDGFKMGLTFTL